MKISVTNLTTEYPKIKTKLPDVLAKDKYDKMVQSFLPHYDKSDVIKKTVDTFVLKLNEVLAKEHEKTKTEPKKTKTDNKSAKNDKKQAKSVKKPTKSTQKPVTKKAAPQKKDEKCNKVEPIKTEHYTEDVRLIRRFAGCIGKERQRRTILTIFRDFERRITERKVSRMSKHAELVTECSKKLAALLDGMSKNHLTHATMQLDESFSKKVMAASQELAIRTSVNLLKRFVGIEGDKPEKAKVQRIMDAYDRAQKQNKLSKDDFYAAEIKASWKAMKDYVNGQSTYVAIEPTALSGLDNVFCVGKLKATAKTIQKKASGSGSSSAKRTVKRKAAKKPNNQLNGVDNNSAPVEQVQEPVRPETQEPVVVSRFTVDIAPEPPASVQGLDGTGDKEGVKSDLFTPITAEIAGNGQSKIELPTDLGKFLGYVERYEYSILLRGDKGAGKSRMTYQMMNTFAKAGFTVGCFSLEIGKQSNIVKDMRDTYISPTIADRVQIADSAPNGLEDIKAAARMFDVVCIDSWGKIPNVKSDDFDKLRKEFPETMFIVIFQSTTNGTARGGSAPEYDAGIVIQVQAGGRAICEKNRYSGEDLMYLVFERRLATPEEMAG